MNVDSMNEQHVQCAGELKWHNMLLGSRALYYKMGVNTERLTGFENSVFVCTTQTVHWPCELYIFEMTSISEVHI